MNNTHSQLSPDYIQLGTTEYTSFLSRLQFSSKKRNRDIFCLRCWRIMSQEKKRDHPIKFPGHESHIITSKHYDSEEKFISLA